jgi:hypothetical protein
MIIINILNFWSIIAHYDSWSIGRKIGDSSTLITSLADGGKRSRFKLCGGISASAKAIPHFLFHRSAPIT